MSKILLHDIGHSHAQPRRKVLRRHCLLFPGILQQLNHTIREPLHVTRRIEFDRQFLPLCHLPKVHQVSANNGHAIGAGQMCNAAASRGRRVRHDRNSGALKQIGQRIFRHIAAKLNAIISRTQPTDRLRITRRLRVVSAGDHEFGIG